VRENYRFGQERRVPLVAFARHPTDARTACIAIIESREETSKEVAASRELGAPVVLACHERKVQWWKQGAERPELIEELDADQVEHFVRRQHQEFAPSRLYQAKTQGIFNPQLRLDFVDTLLMPTVEHGMGQQLGKVLGELFIELQEELPERERTDAVAHQLLKDAFWLLAARILRDKEVPAFADLTLGDAGEVLRRVGKHYGEPPQLHHHKLKYLKALSLAAARVEKLGHLGQVTTEALTSVFETMLVTKELRQKLGIHSTPPYLADYMLGRLQERIESIPREQRHVFEPACGHGAFLVSALRKLRDMLPESQNAHSYLQAHLHGLEIDRTALEIARLSLTLADIPNPNGWDLRQDDMFKGAATSQLASEARILLANPPFEDFDGDDKRKYRDRQSANKAEELLSRTLPHLPPGAVFGLVLPQGFLRSKSGTQLRQHLLKEFELDEVLLLPDKVFAFADVETTVLLGYKAPAILRKPVRYRRVREKELEEFRKAYSTRSDRQTLQGQFLSSSDFSFYLPELYEIWERGRERRLKDIALVGRGLEYEGENKPEGRPTWSEARFEGAVRGYALVLPEGMQLHGGPKEFWLSLDEDVVRRPGMGTDRGHGQVLVPHRPTRQAWRLRAVIDSRGRPTKDVFLIVRPKGPANPPLELLWALCNSSYANAYIHTHASKRDINIGQLEDMPVPNYGPDDEQRLVREVQAYFEAARLLDRSALDMPADEIACRNLLRRIDALVLRLYDLPPRLEGQLLDLFQDLDERPGVPFQWKPYLPKGFKWRMPLYVYLAAEDGLLADLPALQGLTGHLASARLSQLAYEDLEQEIEMLYEERASLYNFRSERGSTPALESRAKVVDDRLEQLQEEEAQRVSGNHTPQFVLPVEREPELMRQALFLLQKYGDSSQ
jgi:hypothetical protein